MDRFALLISLAILVSGSPSEAQQCLGRKAGEPPGTPPSRKDEPLTEESRKCVIDGYREYVRQKYILTDQIAAINASLSVDKFANIRCPADLAKAVAADLAKFDKHFDLYYFPEVDPKKEQKRPPPRPGDDNGFRRAICLPGNVGYLELDGFAHVDDDNPNDDAKKAALAAMKTLSNTDSLIIDLRQNRGGSPYMVKLLISCLLGDKMVHLNTIYDRDKDTTTEFWTEPTLDCKKFEGKPVSVLTSNTTFSAAEEFVYDLQNLNPKRKPPVKIIGEQTGGGAHPVQGYLLEGSGCHGFIAAIPSAKSINPTTKTNWEKVGVTPDIKMSARDAANEAYRRALRETGQTHLENRAGEMVRKYQVNDVEGRRLGLRDADGRLDLDPSATCRDTGDRDRSSNVRPVQ